MKQVLTVITLIGLSASLFSVDLMASTVCPPFTIYTKNLQRSITPNDPPGPLGDMVLANGLIYPTILAGAEPVGTFDLLAFAASVTDTTERRQLSIGLSLGDAQSVKSGSSKRRCGFSTYPRAGELAPTNTLALNGVATYPVGGGILSNPIYLGISSGTGLLTGARGSVKISYDPQTQFFAYTLTLLRQ